MLLFFALAYSLFTRKGSGIESRTGPSETRADESGSSGGASSREVGGSEPSRRSGTK